ncbi:MAG: M36 family metallopeptidase [Planctomycetota bacterium]|nr:M36 family metallopeptidase [Planctomycetota bacterium]
MLLALIPLIFAQQGPAQLQLPSTKEFPTNRLERFEAIGQEFLHAEGLRGTLRLDRDLGWSQTADRVTFDRLVLGHPVLNETVKVVLFRDGSAIVEGQAQNLTNAQMPNSLMGRGAAEATAVLAQPAEENHFIQESNLAWFGQDLVWDIRTKVIGDGTWHVDTRVNAETGEVLEIRDLRIRRNGGRADGSGDVFDPNPVQTSGNHNLKDSNDSNSAVPSSEYFTVVLKDLDGTGYLTGPWCSTSPTSGRVKETSLQFHYQRKADGFEEVMCYYHVDMFQRYLQSIGLNNANRRQQKFDVNGTSQDNSWYDMGSRIITVGSGGVDDGEDADIIVHEYGHALHDDVQGGIGNGQNGAMSEAYGDYFAASFYDDALVGEWDAVSYTGGSLHYLRRVDGEKHYPNDLNGWVHDDGEIWSAMLWDMRMGLGREIADNIIVEAMSLQSNGTNMPSGGNWLLTVDQQLYNGAWTPYIEWALHKRGIKTLGSGDITLMPSDSSPTPNKTVTFTLNAGNHGGQSYATLVSLQPGLRHLGNPYNVDIHVGLDLLI